MNADYPNVVLITVDCWRYDRCGFNGHTGSTTPFLDSLATESYVFDNAFATGPYTPESVPGFLAGLHAKSTPYEEKLNCKAIPPDSTTVAEHLNDHGYTTWATITNPHLSEKRGFSKGFDAFENLRIKQSGSWRSGSSSGTSQRIRKRIMEQTRYPNVYLPLFVAHRFRLLSDWVTIDGQEVKQRFLDQLKQTASNQPFFGWTHFMDVHAPLHPGRYRDRNGKSVDGVGQFAKYFATDEARICGIPHPRYGEFYDGVLRYVDQQIESLVNELVDQGLWESTVLIVTGDHGEAFCERGEYGHPNHYMFDELLKVPLLVRVPGTDGERIKQIFSLGWLHELIAEVTGVDPAPVPATTQTQRHLSVTEEDRVAVSDSVDDRGYSVVVRDSSYKYVEHRSNTIPQYVPNRKYGYYINRDKSETNPHEPGGSSERLQDIADEYVIRPEDVPSLDGELSSAASQRLKQLGYIS